MAGKPRSFKNPGNDIVSYVRELLEEGLGGRLESAGCGTKSEAFRFRQRLYSWRRNIIDHLADPEVKDYDTNSRWLKSLLGPRGTVAWLDLTIFRVEEREGLWGVVGEVRRPMHGRLPQDEAGEQFKKDVDLINSRLRMPGLRPEEALDIEAIARNLSVDPAFLQARATQLKGKGLTPEMIEGVLKEEFA